MVSDDERVSVTDDCLSFVLEYLHSNKKAMKSHCYNHGFGTRRIDRMFETLDRMGCLDSYIKDKGQKRPVYSLNGKGMDLYCLNMMIRECIEIGTVDLEEEIGEELLRKLRSRYFEDE